MPEGNEEELVSDIVALKFSLVTVGGGVAAPAQLCWRPAFLVVFPAWAVRTSTLNNERLMFGLFAVLSKSCYVSSDILGASRQHSFWLKR